MTPGERFDQDEVLRFGDPWHGLWRNGVIELPNSTTRAPGGAPSNGSSFAIKIPGQPAVTTSTEDAAQGMTWLNYAIMTGDGHAVYGRAMGNDAWIFIDADGVPWRSVMALSGGTMTITLHRFGLFGAAEETYSESVGFSWGPGPGVYMNIDDVDRPGRQAALVFRGSDNAVLAVFLVTLSGAGASFSLGVTDETPNPLVSVETYSYPDAVSGAGWHKDGDGVVTGPYEIDNSGALIGAPSGGSISKAVPLMPHYSNTFVYVVGATLIGDVFALVTFTVFVEILGVTTVAPGDLFDINYYYGEFNTYFPPYHESYSNTGYIKVTLNGLETEMPTAWSGEFWREPPFEQEEVDESYYWVEGSFGTIVSHAITPVTVNGVAEAAPYSLWFSGNNWGSFTLRGTRVSNRCYASFRAVSGPNNSVFSPSDPTLVQYATAHPISGDMVTGPSMVCWV